MAIFPPTDSHLGQRLEEISLVSERVVHQTIAKGDDAVRKVVLREPGHYSLLLHVWPPRYVDDQVTQILPVPAISRQTKIQIKQK